MSFESFGTTEKNFFDSSFIQNFDIKPDAKYTALRQGLLDYYRTYHSMNGNFYEYLEKYPNGTIDLAQSKGNDFLTRYFASVSLIQLFIEQYIKEILETVDPLLVNSSLPKENKFMAEIGTNNISAFTLLGSDKTIPYSYQLKRLCLLIKNDASIPINYRIPSRFHFIEKNEEFLSHMAGIRNSIIHKGNQIMTKYSFEVQFVNYIIPFIRTILRLENQEVFLERNIYIGINILDELNKLKLDVDYKNSLKFEKIKETLRLINHLKELGRASYQNRLYMGEGITQEQLAHQEESHNKKYRIVSALEARIKVRWFGFEAIYFCPCCGTNSLTTHEHWTSTTNGRTRVESAKCFECSYSINKEIGEPKEFNIMTERIFNYVPAQKRGLWRRFIDWLLLKSLK